uniref:Uncharacterized protein n=1 Tax=Ananas comosus var. bracteatus TaxID=296719 RepID=A0A6V7QUR6_ANACO
MLTVPSLACASPILASLRKRHPLACASLFLTDPRIATQAPPSRLRLISGVANLTFITVSRRVRSLRHHCRCIARESCSCKELDQKVRDAFHLYIEACGINEKLFAFLQAWLYVKDHRNLMRWFKSVGAFINEQKTA